MDRKKLYRLRKHTTRIFATNGVEFGLLYACENCNELIGYVKYILKDSDADGKNIQRGDFFTGVNGTRLTSNNYDHFYLVKIYHTH